MQKNYSPTHVGGRLAQALALLMLTTPACGDDTDPGDNQNNNSNQAGPFCGDGVRQGVEECDEGASNSDTMPDACRTDCTLPRCGDGALDSGEE